MRTSVVSAAAGLVAGLVAVIALGAALGWGDTAGVVAEATTSGIDGPREGPVYFDPAEVIVGQAALIPDDLAVEGDTAVFTYDLRTITPLEGMEPGYVGQGAGDPGTPVDPLTLTPVFPAAWTLLTSSGEIPGVTPTVTSRSARFTVPSGFSPSQATGLRLESYRVPLPVGEVFEMSEAEPVFAVAPGVSVSLIQIVDQGDQAIVQVEIVADEPFNRENLTVEGVGSVWASAVREAEGRPRYNLRRTGSDVPDTLLLRVRGMVWLGVNDPIDVPLGDG